MFRILTLAMLLVAATVAHSDQRPYISTRLAKAVMQSSDVIPDEDSRKLCDGSGFITHFDGHRTPCPGCDACKPDGDIGKRPEASGPVLGAVKAVVTQGKPILVAPMAVGSNLMVYHLGAEWCPPCRQMKASTWSNPRLRQFMKDKGVTLHLLDADTAKDRKFFDYYKVSRLPTVIIVDKRQLNTPKSRVTGFVSADTMVSLLQKELENE